MSKTILIVEDDEELQELYAAMLEEVDCQLVHAYDGDEALAMVEEICPDLIVLDILLDEVMGDAFFVQVKKHAVYANIPIVIASVLPSESCGKLLSMDPRTHYLQKPFRKAELLNLVE
jgi:DNA-binding response OmpR family regulator